MGHSLTRKTSHDNLISHTKKPFGFVNASIDRAFVYPWGDLPLSSLLYLHVGLFGFVLPKRFVHPVPDLRFQAAELDTLWDLVVLLLYMAAG